MEDQDYERANLKDLPLYVWHNKQEGKEEYAKFAKQFKLALKHLRYLLEPGAVQRRLGPDPGPAPQQVALRREWREDKKTYDAKAAKVEEHFAAALSALESSFGFATSPRHIIDVAIDNPPNGLPLDQWSYQLKFEAAWEALRLEYQPSTVTDLSLLKEQIMALNDQIPGGFDQFKSEFHRLHTEILATNVPDAITPRELNGIVREGIKNPTVWAFVCHDIYRADPNAPWERTFEDISALLTSFRLKGIDPYGEAHASPLVGHLPVSANSVSAMAASDFKNSNQKKRAPPRDSGGRFNKTQKTTTSESYSQGKQRWTSTQTTTKQDSGHPRGDRKCSRCWQTTAHSYRDCKEAKCACGQPLANGQPICYNYDNHPANAKFTDDRLPNSLAKILEAYRRGKSNATPQQSGQAPPPSAPRGTMTRGKAKKLAKAMAANFVEELTKRGISNESLDKTS